MIARRQPMNSWRPPISRMWSGPGWMKRWKVLPSTMSKPSAATSAACSDFTVAVEASGTKAGVRTSPCGVWMTPARAEPSRASMSKTGTVGKATRAPARAGRWRGRPAGRPPRDAVQAPPPDGGAFAHGLLRLGRAALDGGRPAVRAGAGLDLHPARLALLGLRDPDLEDPAVEARGDRVGGDAVGERQRAAEAAEGALDAVPTALARLVLGLALAGDREHAVLDLDRHVVLGHAGKIGLQDEMVFALDEVDRRDPAPRLLFAPAEEGVEEPVDITAEGLRIHH